MPAGGTCTLWRAVAPTACSASGSTCLPSSRPSRTPIEGASSGRNLEVLWVRLAVKDSCAMCDRHALLNLSSHLLLHRFPHQPQGPGAGPGSGGVSEKPAARLHLRQLPRRGGPAGHHGPGVHRPPQAHSNHQQVLPTDPRHQAQVRPRSISKNKRNAKEAVHTMACDY